MQKQKLIHGVPTRRRDPNWAPIEDLLGDKLPDWLMWMFEVQLEDGSFMQVYKHTETRRYIHMTSDGRGFFYEDGDSYKEAPLDVVVGQAYIGRYLGCDELIDELSERLESVRRPRSRR